MTKLNPNASEFKFNPNAAAWTPSSFNAGVGSAQQGQHSSANVNPYATHAQTGSPPTQHDAYHMQQVSSSYMQNGSMVSNAAYGSGHALSMNPQGFGTRTQSGNAALVNARTETTDFTRPSYSQNAALATKQYQPSQNTRVQSSEPIASQSQPELQPQPMSKRVSAGSISYASAAAASKAQNTPAPYASAVASTSGTEAKPAAAPVHRASYSSIAAQRPDLTQQVQATEPASALSVNPAKSTTTKPKSSPLSADSPEFAPRSPISTQMSPVLMSSPKPAAVPIHHDWSPPISPPRHSQQTSPYTSGEQGRVTREPPHFSLEDSTSHLPTITVNSPSGTLDSVQHSGRVDSPMKPPSPHTSEVSAVAGNDDTKPASPHRTSPGAPSSPKDHSSRVVYTIEKLMSLKDVSLPLLNENVCL